MKMSILQKISRFVLLLVLVIVIDGVRLDRTFDYEPEAPDCC